MMPGKYKFIFGLANDEIGYIIPKNQWDLKEMLTELNQSELKDETGMWIEEY